MAELTERQRKIVELMGMGLTDTRIAQEFHISAQELNTFISRIKQETGLQSRAELVQLGRSIKNAEKSMNWHTCASQSTSPSTLFLLLSLAAWRSWAAWCMQDGHCCLSYYTPQRGSSAFSPLSC